MGAMATISPTTSNGAKLNSGLSVSHYRAGAEGELKDQITALLARITFPPSHQVPSFPN